MESEQQENSVNTIIRFWRKYSPIRCLECDAILKGKTHILCESCYAEEQKPTECLYCGSMKQNATNGHPFCDHGKCEKRYCRDREDREW